MEKIRVAILGQGRSGRDIHGYHLKEMTDHYEIVAIADPLADRRERAKNEYGCAVYADYKEIFNLKGSVDLVVNATLSHMHAPVTLEFLNQGFNVLSEKPFARTPEEIDELVAAAEKNNVLLAIFQQSRYAPYFQEVKRIIQSGVLGEIIQITFENNSYQRRWDWQTVQDFNAGSLYNTGPHPVDQALHLLDYDGMPDVKCYMRSVNVYGDAEDYVKLIITAPDKPVIDLEISSCCPYPNGAILIHAKNGGLKATPSKIEYKYIVQEDSPDQKLILTPLKQADGTPAYCREELVWHEKVWEAPQDRGGFFQSNTIDLYKMIYGVLKEGKPLDITPAQIRQQIAVMVEAHKQNPMPKKVKV